MFGIYPRKNLVNQFLQIEIKNIYQVRIIKIEHSYWLLTRSADFPAINKPTVGDYCAHLGKNKYVIYRLSRSVLEKYYYISCTNIERKSVLREIVRDKITFTFILR